MGLEVGRAPKRARPTRTIVAPSSTATSKSSVMPIDSSASSRATACSRSSREPAAGVAVVGRHGHEPGDVEAVGAECVDQRGHRRRRAPALLRLLPQVHLHQDPGAGRAAGDLGAELGPVDRLPARDPRRELAHLVALELSEEVPAARPATAVLASSSWARFSPRSTTPASTTSCTRSTSTVLVAATSVIAAGSRPARRGRGVDARRAPRRRARRRSSRSRGAHHDDGLATGDAVAPVGEVVGRRRGAHVDVGEVVDAGAGERHAHRGGDVERGRAGVGRRRDLGAEALDQALEEVGAELVAVRVDARPNQARIGPGGDGRGARRPRRRARPARGRASRRGPRRPPPGLASATGAQSAVSTTSGRPTAVVTAASASGGAAGAASTVTTSRPCTWRSQTHAAGRRDPRPSRAASRARFRGDRVGVVADVVTQVERCVGRGGDAAVAVGEDDPDARRLELDQRSISADRLSEGTRGRRTGRRRRRRRHRPSRSRCRRRGRRRRRDRAT